MTKEQDYIRDIADIRAMMVRSTKFLSLSGWAGILVGIYALTGAWLAYNSFTFQPNKFTFSPTPSDTGSTPFNTTGVLFTALTILILSIATALILSSIKAHKKGERAWNATSRRLMTQMAIPLTAGGILMVILWSKGLYGLMVPLSLLFYGLAIYSASTFTFNEIKYLGLFQISLGLLATWFMEYGLLFWAIGFGIIHIGYGIYMHFRYER